LVFDSVRVLGIEVHCVLESDVLQFVLERVATREPAQVVTVNAEFVMLARADSRFRDVLAAAHLATPDGAGVVWAARRKGATIRRRVGGSDLIWSLSRQAAEQGHGIFLLGAAEGVAASAARRLQSDLPALVVSGSYAGSPAPGEEGSIVDLVRMSGAQILFVAFGAPEQDLWIARNLSRSGAVVGMGVGGSFDYLAGTARRAPVWMQERGLDWLWRLIQQPWRWKRMLALPRFAWAVLREGREQSGARKGKIKHGRT
jgi:N-acetylglucosaminyldiphosphoundecaprenol N-acetyl-beta-D-mannosaminyltransferase